MKKQLFPFLIFTLSLWVFSYNVWGQDSNIVIQDNNISISATENIRLSTGTSGKAYYNDKEIAVKNDASRSATIVIAASNASEKSKSGADFVCTGNGDQEVFNTALNSLPECGGVIQLTEGDFHFHNSYWSVEKDVIIQGCGGSTVIHRHFVYGQGQSTHYGDSMFRAHYNRRWHFRDFIINSNNMETQGNYNYDIICWTYNEGEPEGECIIENVHVINGLIHQGTGATISFFITGANSRIENCSIQGKNYSNSINVTSAYKNNQRTHINNCEVESLIAVYAHDIFLINNRATDVYMNSFRRASVTGNMLNSLTFDGNQVLVTGNICKYINSLGVNSVVSNNLTPQ